MEEESVHLSKSLHHFSSLLFSCLSPKSSTKNYATILLSLLVCPVPFVLEEFQGLLLIHLLLPLSLTVLANELLEALQAQKRLEPGSLCQGLYRLTIHLSHSVCSYSYVKVPVGREPWRALWKAHNFSRLKTMSLPLSLWRKRVFSLWELAHRYMLSIVLGQRMGIFWHRLYTFKRIFHLETLNWFWV